MGEVVAVRFGELEMQIRELDVETLSRLARQNGTDWATVIDMPSQDPVVARAVITVIAGRLDVECPQMTTGTQVIAAIREHIVLVNDDLPEMPEPSTNGQVSDVDPTDVSSTAG